MMGDMKAFDSYRAAPHFFCTLYVKQDACSQLIWAHLRSSPWPADFYAGHEDEDAEALEPATSYSSGLMTMPICMFAHTQYTDISDGS